jgi:hypothetical protein
MLVFPEGREFKHFKRWLLEFGDPADDYHDTTAGCYVIRSVGAEELELFGFKIDIMSQKQYGRMVGEELALGYHRNGRAK